MSEAERPGIRPPWARSDRFVPRVVVRPFQAFLSTSTASGILLVGAAIAALVWANWPAGDSYDRVWRIRMELSFGDRSIAGDLRFWVNEGLMTFFFLVAGLEIKRELLIGELRDVRRAVLPFVAALGGMAVPALIYVTMVNGPATRAWGAAMPTDIAFTLGVLALVSRHSPPAMKPFFLALAIVDDLGTIVILAFLYSAGLGAAPLGLAAAAAATMVVFERLHVRAPAVYIALGVAIWVGFEQGGVHPALAGAAVGLLTPAHPFQRPSAVSQEAHRTADETVDDPSPPDSDAHWWLRLAWLSREAVSPLARVEHVLLPWASYVALPVFALANAGVPLTWGSLARSPAIALVVSRVIGKVLGIVGMSYLAVRFGRARLPQGVRWVHLVGGALASAIAFSVSLFVVDLAFAESSELLEAAKVGILASGLVAGTAAVAVLRTARGGRRPSEPKSKEVSQSR